jgi:hypothetical protein
MPWTACVLGGESCNAGALAPPFCARYAARTAFAPRRTRYARRTCYPSPARPRALPSCSVCVPSNLAATPACPTCSSRAPSMFLSPFARPRHACAMRAPLATVHAFRPRSRLRSHMHAPRLLQARRFTQPGHNPESRLQTPVPGPHFPVPFRFLSSSPALPSLRILL